MTRFTRACVACVIATAFQVRGGTAAGEASAFISPATVCTAQSPRLPATIALNADLRPHVEAMLKQSATFRAQCRRIADASKLRVQVRVNVLILQCTCRARTVVQRSASVIVAVVDIGPFGDPVPWIAHEFEHLLEQLDGLRLSALSERGRGVWRTNGEMFETERAIRAGRAVSDEMRPRRRRTNKLVE